MNFRKNILLYPGLFVLIFFSYKVFTRYYFHDFLHEVPAVIGLSEKEARKLLSKNDLEIKVMGEQYSHLPEGQIVVQNPKENSVVKSGRRIQVWLSRGQNLLQIPSLVGTNLLTAQSLVQQQGLIIDKISYIPKDLPYNEILATDPDLSKPVAKRSKISFLVSGSANSSDLNLKVPDVIGYPVEDAKFILEAEQLLLGNIIKKPSEGTEAGIVLGTSIPAGRSVNLSTKIDLIVSE